MKITTIAAVDACLIIAAIALSTGRAEATGRSWDVSGSWFLTGAGDFYNFHVSVDGGDATQIVEQGKGTRPVPVEAGRTYRYILTDSGEELATTTVQGR